MTHYLSTLADHPVQTKCKSVFSDKLKKLKKLIEKCKKGAIVDFEKLYTKFCDCGVKAQESIPVALFAFLVASNKKCENEVNSKLKRSDAFDFYGPVERVIFYAISLGGDTDTIASMAGAIAGAFFGLSATKCQHILKSCESYDDAINFANKLFDISKH